MCEFTYQLADILTQEAQLKLNTYLMSIGLFGLHVNLSINH